MKKKQVVFLLPEYYEKPIGGYKVVFEYSNRLINSGLDVTIVYPYFLYFLKSSLKRKLKMLYFYFYYMFFKRKGIHWFPIDKDIKNAFIFSLKEKHIPYGDVYIATAMETAVLLDKCKNIKHTKKHYLIQALEDWQWGKAAALNTWKLNLNKIVISPWLHELAQNIEQKSILIENGVDRNCLSKSNPIENRDKFTIMMLYHRQKLKGCDLGLKALKELKKQYPQIKSIWFGCPDRPLNIPDWIDYYKMPEDDLLNKLYNTSGIFMGTSYSEGFGLTIGEAMTCGCAVVCTNAGGYLTMAKHRETALVSETGNAVGLINNITELIENDILRHHIAKNGHAYIQQFTWDKAYNKFYNYLTTSI